MMHNAYQMQAQGYTVYDAMAMQQQQQLQQQQQVIIAFLLQLLHFYCNYCIFIANSSIFIAIIVHSNVIIAFNN